MVTKNTKEIIYIFAGLLSMIIIPYSILILMIWLTPTAPASLWGWLSLSYLGIFGFIFIDWLQGVIKI